MRAKAGRKKGPKKTPKAVHKRVEQRDRGRLTKAAVVWEDHVYLWPFCKPTGWWAWHDEPWKFPEWRTSERWGLVTCKLCLARKAQDA